jgi:nitroreductase
MDVIDALNARRSVRAYLPKPVPRETLEAIVAAAARTPSWANTQPWQVFVVTGEALARIREGFAQCHARGEKPQIETATPDEWPQAARDNTRALQEAQAEQCGEALAQFGPLNQTMFEAPAVVYICMDKSLGHWSLYDIGAYSQSLMLAAQEYGVDSIPAMTLTLYSQVIRQEIEIADDLQITIGIALGYCDDSNGINNLQSPRAPLAQTVHWFE